MSDTMIASLSPISDAIAEMAKENREEILSDNQEQALQTVEPEVTPYSNEDIEALKAVANGDDAPETFFEERQQDVIDGRMTPEQFEQVLGVEYEAPFDTGETSETENKPSIGHNKPPTDPTALEVFEELKAYKPKDATNTAEAQEKVKEAMLATVEYINQGETSLASKGAIAIADYVAFNAGLIGAGNKLFTVNSGMYRQILDSLSGMVDSEDAQDSSFKVRVGQMIKRAILLMDGKISVGFFVLPADRKAARAGDEALPECPSDVPEGARVVRSTVVRENILMPRIPVQHPRTGEIMKDQTIDNSSATALRLLSNEVANALYETLWDRDGELQYHPIKGHILGFKSGKTLKEEEEKAKAQLERDKKAAETKQPETRQTRGTQSEDATAATVEQLKEQLGQARQDASAAVEANKGDIMSALNGLGAYIRDTSQPMPEQARTTFWKDANALFARRLIGPNVKPSRDEMRELVKLITNLDNHMKWDDQKGIWSFMNVDGNIVTTFGADLDDKAA